MARCGAYPIRRNTLRYCVLRGLMRLMPNLLAAK